MGAKFKAVIHSRALRLLLIVLVIVAIAAIGVSQHLQKRAASLEYAVSQFNEALAVDNLEKLAQMVDVGSLSEKLATAWVAAQPDVGQDAQQRYRNTVRRKLQFLFAKKPVGGHEPAKHGNAEEKNPDKAPDNAQADRLKEIAPLDNEIFNILKLPTQILPPNFLNQLKAHPLVIQAQDENAAILSTKVDHAQLKHSFILRLAMQRTDRGWRVNDFSNTDQLVKEFLDQLNAVKNEAMEAFEQENARQQLLMNTYYHIGSCRAVVFPPDAAAGVVRLRITLKGSNLGERDALASGSVCDMFDQSGVKVASLRVENTRVVNAGTTFDHAWFFNFEERYPELDALLAAGRVRCVATPSTVSLVRGIMLRTRDVNDLPGVQLE